MSGPGSDVSAELSDYLEQKGVNALFLELVEYLLAEKPSNPVQFFLSHLVKHYPDMCQIPRVIGFETEEGALWHSPAGSGAGAAVTERPVCSVKYDRTEQEEEDEAEDDERRDKPIHRRSRRRRGSVSAQSIEPDDVRPVQSFAAHRCDADSLLRVRWKSISDDAGSRSQRKTSLSSRRFCASFRSSRRSQRSS